MIRSELVQEYDHMLLWGAGPRVATAHGAWGEKCSPKPLPFTAASPLRGASAAQGFSWLFRVI